VITKAQRHGFWLRWVGANALAEMIGLGVAGAVGMQVFAGGPENLRQALLSAAPEILAGARSKGLRWAGLSGLLCDARCPACAAGHGSVRQCWARSSPGASGCCRARSWP
jgi:hypothetical protein